MHCDFLNRCGCPLPYPPPPPPPPPQRTRPPWARPCPPPWPPTTALRWPRPVWTCLPLNTALPWGWPRWVAQCGGAAGLQLGGGLQRHHSARQPARWPAACLPLHAQTPPAPLPARPAAPQAAAAAVGKHSLAVADALAYGLAVDDSFAAACAEALAAAFGAPGTKPPLCSALVHAKAKALAWHKGAAFDKAKGHALADCRDP